MRTFLSLFLIFVFSTAVSGQIASEGSDFSYPLKLYNQEFYDLAAQQFVKYYNKYPNSPKVDEARYYAGMSYFKLGQYSQARVQFQSLAIENPNSPKAAESWLNSGRCYVELNNKAEAVKSFETIRLLYPENPFAPEGLFRAGEIHVDAGNIEQALSNFNIIMDRYSGSSYYPRALAKGARAYFLQNDIQKAQFFIDKVFESQPDDQSKAEANYVLAMVYAIQGDLNNAKKTYDTVIKSYPRSQFATNAVFELSDIYIREKDYIKAQQYLSRKVSEEKDPAILKRLHHLLGDTYFLNTKYALSQKEYEAIKFAKQDSFYLAIQLKLALTKRKQGLDEQAAREFGQVLQNFDQKNAPIYKRSREIYIDWLIADRQHEQAISELHEQILSRDDLVSRIPEAMKLVQILESMQKWRDVIRELEPFLLVQKKYNQRDDVVFTLACAYEKIEDFEQSAYFNDMLITEYSGSNYYEKAKDRLEYLNEYKVVDKNLAVSQLANMVAKLVSAENKSELHYELGQVYYSDLKDYNNASLQFSAALKNDPINMGDVHLSLGKSYLKLAQFRKNIDARTVEYLDLANQNFKSALENAATCIKPDEAAWYLVKSRFASDSSSIEQEKRLIEALLNKYTQSALREDWYAHLSFALAFEPKYQKESILYFEKLIQEYKTSKQLPVYLLQYAKLVENTDREKAINLYRTIAGDYPNSHEAVFALFEVAKYYEKKEMYSEANTLYSRLNNLYYYSDIADQIGSKLGQIHVLAGEYRNAINVLLPRIESPFKSDYLLTNEFMPESVYDDILFLAEAYNGANDDRNALEHYRLYLNVAAKGKYRERAQVALGRFYFENDQKHIALDFFKSVSQKDSSLYSQSRLYIADIYFESEQYNLAASTYEQLQKKVRDKETLKGIQGKRIISLLRDGKLKAASPLIRTFKSTFPDEESYTAQFVLEYGKYYRASKDYDKAIRSFNEVKKKHDDSGFADDAEYYLALTYLTLNRNEDAYEILSNFYTNYSKSDKLPEVLNSLGSMYFRSEKYDDAINMFKNALKSASDKKLEQSILSNLIKAYSFTGFWDAAQAMARKYVEEFPYADDRLDKKLTIGRSYINLNQFQNAVEYLRRIKLEADSELEPEIQFYIGDALLKAGEYENAIAEFVKIPLLSKKTKLQWEASALYYSGQAYEKLGRINDAIRMYKEIVKRPGIDLTLKQEAEKRIKQIQG